MTDRELLKEARDLIVMCSLLDKNNQCNEMVDKLDKQLSIPVVVKSLPNDEEVKAYIDTLPYYGTCTTEYNEGFEDGIKWLKGQMSK